MLKWSICDLPKDVHALNPRIYECVIWLVKETLQIVMKNLDMGRLSRIMDGPSLSHAKILWVKKGGREVRARGGDAGTKRRKEGSL